MRFQSTCRRTWWSGYRIIQNNYVLAVIKENLTLLFCDVRGFTPISELFDPPGLTNLINQLLTPLTNVILSNKGTVDKYMGDCIMAFWNAPLEDDAHPYNACKSALLMLNEMDPLNERLKDASGP